MSMKLANHWSSQIKRRVLQAGAGALSLVAAAACSGGSGPAAEPVSPANSAPRITGSLAITVSENMTEVGAVSATDADGDMLTYALAGGPDASAFEITSNSGVIRFVQSPDFERPDDSDGDNVYHFTVRVSDDAGGSASADFAVTVSNLPDTRYLEPIFTGTTISPDIVYAQGSDDYVLNVITPQGDTETSRPLALIASGGAFAFTSRFQVQPFAEAFARAGYVAAIMDYRTLGRMAESPLEFRLAGQDANHDMIAALRFLRANAAQYGIDPETAIVGGTSAGAFMALGLGTLDPDDPLEQDLIDYVSTRGGVYGNVGAHLDQSPHVQGVWAISGAVPGLDKIDRDSAPVYAAHNELDSVAPCGTFTLTGTQFEASGTCDFVPVFEDLGVPVGAFIVPDDTGHVDFTEEEYRQIMAEALQLYYENVLSVD
ncbi:cadherin domain-containing protein [Maricaulaceae bacterium MS644]